MSLRDLHWNDAYALGIERIDDQHHKLFEIVQEIFELEDHSRVKEDIKRIFYELSDYMATHFKDEERYMEQIGFPELDAHRQRHDQIIEQTGNILKSMRPGTPLSVVKTKMKVAARQLLVQHIVEEDMKIKLYLLKKRAQTNDEGIIDLD